MKLRTKMFLVYSVVAIIPILAIGYYSYSRWQTSVSEQIRTYSSTVIHNAVEQSNNTLDRINRTLDFMTYYSDDSESSIIEILSEFADGPVNYSSYDILQAGKRTNSIFGNLMYANSSIRGIYLITPDSLILGTSNDQTSSINPNHDCRSDYWYQETLSLNGQHYISTITSDDLFTDENPSIYLSRSIYDVYSHKFLGVILLDLNPEILNLDSLTAIPDLALLFIENTKTGETLYSNVDSLKTNETQYTDDMQKIELNLEPLELSISFHYDTLYAQYNPMRMVILLMIFVFAAGVLISLYLITGKITFPLERLSRVMKHQRKNGLKFVSPYMGRTDEIGTLYNEYSHMLDEINEGIQRDYQNRLIVLDAQMKALEARINSHFLFNTLESINSMAELADNKEIATMSLALGDMFRYAIKTPGEIVTLTDELKHVDDYASIQLIRFNGKFRLEKNIPPALLSCPVLKLILQPLVENALFHGLNYCTTGDLITISAVQENLLLHISVSDNGVGMNPETLAMLRSTLMNQNSFSEIGHHSGQSIGLGNIHARIQLYYGKQYGLSIASTENIGTRITITIPITGNSPKIQSEEVRKNRGAQPESQNHQMN